MADYDVEVLGLTTPAAIAPLTQCRPVVSVRNNGLYDATASGYLRIYSAGLLIFETEVYSDTIAPGDTRPASAVEYWTPPAEGLYVVQGYVSSPLDQVESNNNLQPTTIEIRGSAPVPPETPVPFHASQHESGGKDELSIEDLPGRAADGQTPIAHASNHMVAGIDPINVEGLPGVLGQGQTPKSHAASHKLGGGDALDVLALPNADELELVAHKGVASGYAPLDSWNAIPFNHLILGSNICEPDEDPDARGLRQDRFVGQTNPVPHAATHLPGARDTLPFGAVASHIRDVVYVAAGAGAVQILRLDLTPAQLEDACLSADLAGYIATDAGPSHTAAFTLRFHSTEFTENIAIAVLDLNLSSLYHFHVRMAGGIRKPLHLYAHGLVSALTVNPPVSSALMLKVAVNVPGGIMIQDTSNFYFEILATCAGGMADLLSVDTAAGSCVIP